MAMAPLATKHSSRLKDIQEKIKRSAEYFKKNNERYHEYIRFVFNTSMDDDMVQKLQVLNKPCIEFNILEAYISRLRGEFSKQEPSLTVRASDGMHVEDFTPDFLAFLEVIEAHLREIFFEATNDALEYNIYSDLLAGGFSVAEVFTDYINDKSFEQCIKVERVFDPTLAGFDPMARESHKGDGDYCFKIVPQSRQDFEVKYGSAITDQMSFTRGYEGFNWSYVTQTQEVVLLVEFYEKHRKKVRLVKLSNGHSVEKKQYERFLEIWSEESIIEQPPIVLEERWTTVDTIHRYMVCESLVLEHEETSYTMFPIVFIDGNSMPMQDSIEGPTYQMTRPFIYHAKDIQKLKNFAGQTMAAWIEGLIASKFIAPVEAISSTNMSAWLNPQIASTLLYNAFYKDNPDVLLPPPREVVQSAPPPLVENIFMGADNVTQMILGSYDSLLSTNDRQISGVAIQQGAMQSNAAAIPYLMGYIKGLNRIAEIIVDLIPKYYVTPRTIPVKNKDGKRSYQLINKKNKETGRQAEGSLDFRYDPSNLNVKVEAGVNNAVQKQVALDQIRAMMQASEIFAQFINTKGLDTLISNMDIRGSEQMRAQAEQFMQELQQQKEAQSQQQDPMLQVAQAQVQAEHEVGMARVQAEVAKAEGQHAIDTAKVAVEKQKVELAYLEIMAKVKAEDNRMRLDRNKAQNAEAQEAIKVALDIAKHHREEMDR